MPIDECFTSKRAQRLPRAEPESEPEGGPESKPERENHINLKTERTWNRTGNSEPEPEHWPEPEPRWNEAYKTWRWAWELHIYMFATAFLAIGLYAGYYVIANVYDGLQGKYLSLSLNVMVALFGFSRAFVMYLDPYHQGNIIHNITVMRIMWSLSGPCLTASDCLMILALVETANISIAPPKLQKASVNATIISLHFILVIISDCVVSTYVEAKIMLLFCQLFFVTWGCVLGTANFVLGNKLDRKLFSHKKQKETADKVYVCLIYASGAANYFLCGIILYSAFGVFGVYSDVQFVDAWPWWALQTLSRFSEILACVLIFTVSAKRTRVKDAVLMVTDDHDHETIYSTQTRNCSDLKEELLSLCFKRKKEAPKRELERKISLFTALREIALMQVAGDRQNVSPIPQPRMAGECWFETNTANSVIHSSNSSYQSSDNKNLQVLNKEEQGSGYQLELEFSRRESMFTALHEAKNIVLDEEKEGTENPLKNNLSGCSNITLPNEAIIFVKGENILEK